MRILLTGATGFVGRHLAADLERRGHEVVAALRTRASAERLPPGIGGVVVGDFAESIDWTAPLTGVDAVVHSAGIAHAGPGLPGSLYERVNRDATLHLAHSAAGRVGKFVFLSSIRAQSGPVADHPLTEADPPQPTDDYGRSKLAAEQWLAAAGLPWAALRPVVVYGPGAAGNMGALLRLARLPVPLPFGGLKSPRSVVSVENLAEAVAFALPADSPATGPLIVADPEPVTLADLVAFMREGLGRDARLFSVPNALIGRALAMLGKEDAWKRLSGSLVADPARLLSLGWQPPVRSTRDGVRRWLSAERPSG
jgi:UDP-glucose 4-epimerase